jgi:haloacid dehalogenase-like hydrolase
MQPSGNILDFDGTLVRENSSNVLIDILIDRAANRPERQAAWLLRGPVQRPVRMLFTLLGMARGGRDLRLAWALWMFRRTLAVDAQILFAAVAGRLTLNPVLAEVYVQPFVVASLGLRPVIEAFAALHPELPIGHIYASEYRRDKSRWLLRLSTPRAKVRLLTGLAPALYLTDYDREALRLQRTAARPYDCEPLALDQTIWQVTAR